MPIDWFIFLPVALGVAAMVPWAYAYFVFPGAIHTILRGVDAGPFEGHLARMARWVRLCGHSHWVMALRDASMLAAMYFELYWTAVVILSASLVFLYAGGAYSLWAVLWFESDARGINKFIRTANRALATDARA